MLIWLFAFIDLLVLWLLMSGVYTNLVIAFGIASSAVTVFLIARMAKIDDEKLQVPLKIFATIGYIFWLVKEIAVSTFNVTKIILSPQMKSRQKLFSIPALQKTDMGQVVFANSITLTPGTITVEIEPGYFLIHALDHSDEDYAGIADMGSRVSNTERLRAKQP